jgi:hypothetical protein
MIKKFLIVAAQIVLMGNSILAQSTDHDEIALLVQKAYVDGTQNLGSISEVRKGFHPDFIMFRFVDEKIIRFTLEEWIQGIEKRRIESPETYTAVTTSKILSIDVMINAATVKMELHKEGKLIFTDYLSLYKFEQEGWRIISKTYYKH